METLIRQATEDDSEALLRLYVELHELHARRLPEWLRIPEAYDERALRTSIKAMLQKDARAILVIEASGALIGLAEISLQKDGEQPLTVAHTYGYLQSLVVLVAFRKHGLGQQLLNAAECWTQERGGTELRLSVWEFAEGPLRFYETLGFQTLKRELVKAL